APPENLPTIFPKPRAMYMEHPFTASEISGSCPHVAQLANMPATLFFILNPGANSSATGAFQNNINSYGYE
ncbi:hypothetical protein, partial [Salmonella enterica]|uniref:hypothetical protein n=1 Tax=Salmonella enterica TaxID=28901 RepID=UPI0032994D05